MVLMSRWQKMMDCHLMMMRRQIWSMMRPMHEELCEEDMPEDGNEDDEPEEESVTHEELNEAWAAGWRAKDQVAEKKKWRSFKLSCS